MDKNEELGLLMNRGMYDKYQRMTCREEKQQFLEEKKFYRKRIQQMAKECSKFGIIKNTPEPPEPLMKAFSHFAKACIDHFRLIDEAECYQKEYDGLDSEDNVCGVQLDEVAGSCKTETDAIDTELLCSGASKKVITMDDFVTKKNSRPTKPLHMPKEKVANVRDKKYRTKGVKKNKSKGIIDNDNNGSRNV